MNNIMKRRLPFSENLPGELIKDINQLKSGDDVYIEYSRKITNIFPNLRKFRGKYERLINNSLVANFTSILPLVKELTVPKRYIINDPQVNKGQVKFSANREYTNENNNPDMNYNPDIIYINNQRLFAYIADIVNDKSEMLHVTNINLLINHINITLKSITKDYVRIYKISNDEIYLKKMISSLMPENGNDDLTKYTLSFLKSNH